jgi:ATP adenylyltransferase
MTHTLTTHLDCCICSQMEGNPNNDLISQLLNEAAYKRRVILENDYFAVIPSLGALVDGHVIICPKKHIKSFALLGNEEYASLGDIKKDLSHILQKTFDKNIHYFEHGSAEKEGKLVCTVDHAHLHVLPTNVNVIDLLGLKYNWVKMEHSFSELRKHVGIQEYLFYEEPNGSMYLSYKNPLGFESQYLRKIFSIALDKNEWNWRNNADAIFTDQIYKKLKVVY